MSRPRVNSNATPQSGTAHELSRGDQWRDDHEIVPLADQLVIDVKISPQEIDQVSIGARVIGRVLAGNQRISTQLNGTFSRISADITRNQQTNISYYTVRVIFIQTHERTADALRLKCESACYLIKDTSEFAEAP